MHSFALPVQKQYCSHCNAVGLNKYMAKKLKIETPEIFIMLSPVLATSTANLYVKHPAFYSLCLPNYPLKASIISLSNIQ